MRDDADAEVGHATARVGLLPVRGHQSDLQSVAGDRRRQPQLAQGAEGQQGALRHAESAEGSQGGVHRGGVHHAPHHAPQHYRRGLHRGAQAHRDADQEAAAAQPDVK